MACRPVFNLKRRLVNPSPNRGFGIDESETVLFRVTHADLVL